MDLSTVEKSDQQVARETEWKDDEVTAENADGFLRWAFDELDRKITQLTIDMTRVKYIDVAGLSSMLRVARLGTYRRILVNWRGLNKNVANLIRLAGLEEVIKLER